jgi:Ankyrin repeats (3 copies)
MKTHEKIVLSLIGVGMVSTTWFMKSPPEKVAHTSADEALLALIKNDLPTFEKFLKAGGKIHNPLPLIDGKTYTIAQGVAYFERTSFAEKLRINSVRYIQQDGTKEMDIMTLAVKKDNLELMNELVKSQPDFSLVYQNGWTLLHMAAAWCSSKVAPVLQDKGFLRWDTMSSDGATPLTLAAENNCLPLLSAWKQQGADFKMKDAKGRSALSLLKSKQDPALRAFADSFEPRMPASLSEKTPVATAKAVPDFYKRRKIPKDKMVDHAAMLEPEDRPLEAVETAAHSEFAD